ncbi:MAG: hypothetical protein GOMPHAMPRED_006351 [Gomphillus americanus]|uniref:Macro domain-like protein n=1 Tax=Gomphillus americanus TaxID=1940652 RepID=A0A8H3I690_9LECA|nr:MAG: hypothetical protein GOMPHAMPRED_006351 [Gomphillus americanus]
MATPANSEVKPVFPSFHLLCMEERFSDAFNQAVKTKWPELPQRIKVTIHDGRLGALDPEIRFDAVVSPANSYARLDGGFDDALARAYRPDEDYYWITKRAQKTLYEKWKGFAPPGTCTVIPLDSEDGQPIQHPWGTKYLLLCPTMAVPCDVQWDREIVYECIWSMLCAVDQHNRRSEDGQQESEIKSILMTPLATGVGRLRAARWAEQTVIALRHWTEAVEQPNLWSHLQWDDIYVKQDELEKTFVDDIPGPV